MNKDKTLECPSYLHGMELEQLAQENCVHMGMDKCPHEGVCQYCKQPAQEPVAMYENGNVNWINSPKDNTPLYTHPQQWQGFPPTISEGGSMNERTAERDYNFMRDLAIGMEELFRWIPIEERLPEDSNLKVVRTIDTNNGKHLGIALSHYHTTHIGNKRWCYDLTTQPTRVSHWMELPHI
jgi:hypothetical protein